MTKIEKTKHNISFNDNEIFENMGIDLYYPPKNGMTYICDTEWELLFNQWVGQNGADYRMEAVSVDGEIKIAVYGTNEDDNDMWIWDFKVENLKEAYNFLIS